MAVFPNTQIALQPPQYWGQNMPDPTSPDWQDYQKWEQSQPWMQPAGQAPSTFTGPDGSQWSAAGSQRMADMTTGQYQADYFNHRLQQAGRDPNGPDAKMFLLAMNSRQQVRPEEFQNAYMAHDDSGNPLLAEPLVSLFERLGVRPTGYDLPAGVTGGTGPSGGTGGGDPLNGPPTDSTQGGVDATYKTWQDDHGFWHDSQHPNMIWFGGGWMVDPFAPVVPNGAGAGAGPSSGGTEIPEDHIGQKPLGQQYSPGAATPLAYQLPPDRQRVLSNFMQWAKQKPVMPAANQGHQMTGYGF